MLRPMPTNRPRTPRRQAASSAVAAAVILLGAAPVAAQSLPARGPVLTSRDLVVLGTAVVAAGGLLPFDTRVARWSQRPALHANAPVRATAAAFRVLGDPGTVVLGGVTYGVGLLADRRATAAVGLHTVAAIAAGGGVSGAIKYGAGRARPYVTGDSDATSAAFARGFRGSRYQSLPSGHATAAFAFAAALSAEGRHRWPATNRVTEPLAYTAASLVALSRIYHDRHWASDVVLGAGVGFVAGRALVRHQHARPDNALDGRLLPRRGSGRVPVPASIGWSIAF